MIDITEVQIERVFLHLQSEIHQMAVDKGWYDGTTERNPAELIALMHSELSEALEAFRCNNPPDKHCPTFGNAEIELADCIIRILDACQHWGINLGAALLAKMEANARRPARHGGKVY
jgi:NTP pyrophosphatase (non-canonical NTP hydrolase)